ncbi:MAG: TIGR01777 family oxidoreductase [Acidimicrobiia bacterium]
MRILLAGSTGLLGSALRSALIERGDEVVRLTRPETTGASGILWDPASPEPLDPDVLTGFDAVVNFAGRSIGEKRWSDREKAALWASRVDFSAGLARAIAASPKPKVWINASAVGFYGDRGDDIVTEDDPQGGGFLAELTASWEAATAPAAEAGVRVVLMRNGIVLSADGGALGRLLAPFGPRWLSPYRWGLGGPVGKGTQYWSWVSLDDHTRATLHALDGEIAGPINVVAPNPVMHRTFIRALGRVLRRPTVMPVPRLVLDAVLGRELAAALVHEGQRVMPERLAADGFEFHDTDVESALRQALAG